MKSRHGVLVTGANGFVGKALCQALRNRHREVTAAVRSAGAALEMGPGAQAVQVGEITRGTDWSGALDGVASVVHLAARVHVMRDSSADPLGEFRRTNTEGTMTLARAAADAGVGRFVYLSSIKVNGEQTDAFPFTERDRPDPQGPYAISKWEAEQGLHRIAAQTGLQVIVVRPPLVYGPGVRGNFLRLLHLLARGLPLPLASAANRRSLLALDNLVDFLALCLEHPGAVHETFLLSDGQDLSTPELLRRIARHMGRRARLAPFPPGLLRLAAGLLGKRAVIDRLLGSLQIDAGKARRMLGWQPPVSVDEGIERTVQWYSLRTGIP